MNRALIFFGSIIVTKRKIVGKEILGDGKVVHYYKAKFKKTTSGLYFDIDCVSKNINTDRVGLDQY